MLKYGCKTTAWASDIQICPQLEWGGPTRQQIFDHHEGYTDAKSWPKRREEIEGKFVKTIGKPDRSLRKVFKTLRLLEKEPQLQAEVKSMFSGNGVSLPKFQLIQQIYVDLTSSPESPYCVTF